jgi:hypothetical protein
VSHNAQWALAVAAFLTICAAVLVWARVTAVRDERRGRGQR